MIAEEVLLHVQLLNLEIPPNDILILGLCIVILGGILLHHIANVLECPLSSVRYKNRDRMDRKAWKPHQIMFMFMSTEME